MACVVDARALRTSLSAVPGVDRYVALDSLRGIGALMVVLYHSKINSSIWGTSIFDNLYLFVDFFFVLSGFVIAANYQSKLESLRGLGEFMRRRFWRLYPLHVFVLMAYVSLELAEFLFLDGALGGVGGNAFSGDRSIAAIFTNLLLVHSLGIHDSLTWNSPSWSISTEFYAYLLFGAVTVLLRNRVRFAATAALLVMPLLIFEFSSVGMKTTSDLGFVRCVFGFAGGVIVWNLVKQFSSSARLRIGPGWAHSFAELSAVAIIVVFLAYADQTSAILIPFVFMAAVLVFTSDRGLVCRLLSTKPFVYIGMWSYSIYMVHLFIRDISLGVAKVIRKLGFDVMWSGGSESLLGPDTFSGNLLLLAYVGVTIAVASLTYRHIEVPGRDIGRRFKRSLSSAK